MENFTWLSVYSPFRVRPRSLGLAGCLLGIMTTCGVVSATLLPAAFTRAFRLPDVSRIEPTVLTKQSPTARRRVGFRPTTYLLTLLFREGGYEQFRS